MKIWIGCDHAGYDLKKEVIAYLEQHAIAYEDLGCEAGSIIRILQRLSAQLL